MERRHVSFCRSQAEASQWTRTVVPNAGSRSLKALVQVVLSDQEVAESISSSLATQFVPTAAVDIRCICFCW